MSTCRRRTARSRPEPIADDEGRGDALIARLINPPGEASLCGPITLSFDPARLHVFDADTQRGRRMTEATVVVTGSAGRIGSKVVRRLLEEGRTVIGFDLKPTGLAHARYREVIGGLRRSRRRRAGE